MSLEFPFHISPASFEDMIFNDLIQRKKLQGQLLTRGCNLNKCLNVLLNGVPREVISLGQQKDTSGLHSKVTDAF